MLSFFAFYSNCKSLKVTIFEKLSDNPKIYKYKILSLNKYKVHIVDDSLKQKEKQACLWIGIISYERINT